MVVQTVDQRADELEWRLERHMAVSSVGRRVESKVVHWADWMVVDWVGRWV